jgi:hypothetical protein
MDGCDIEAGFGVLGAENWDFFRRAGRRKLASQFLLLK